VDTAIGAAVRQQLVADVPLGAFLSGGVDSSLVVAHMGPTVAFSIGFREEGYSEIEWAGRVARHLGVDHRTAILESEMIDAFDHLMHFMDDPLGDFSIFPTYLISRHARSEVTVALSGDGGDELFGGYETYVAQSRARLWNRLPRWLRERVLSSQVRRLRPRPDKKGVVNKARRFVEGFDHEEALAHARWRLFVGDSLRRELFTEAALSALETGVEDHILALAAAAGPRPDLDRSLYVDVRSYLTDNCLAKVDRMSMACSLEVRVPLLEHHVVELAFQIPPGLKVRGGMTKPLLKAVAARHVPRESVYRPKEGFSIPIKHWLTGKGQPLMEELLDLGRVRREGLFKPATVERLKREHRSGVENHSHILWSLIVFEDWRTRWSV
jgi:asparagine synthase (glutamine-hydrolysing)